MKHVEELKTALSYLAIPEKAEFFPRFFKSDPGQYAEGDVFLGVTVPDQRKIVKEFWNKLDLGEVQSLLSSEVHEHRHVALLILVEKYQKAKDLHSQKEMVDFYLENKKYINNWDLVDNSCYKILGHYCYENHQDNILVNLAEEDSMWSKRIAVVSTLYYVKQNSFKLLKNIVLKNLRHPHDLIHKANGWVLREMGKKNEQELIEFLALHYQNMPRTTLRYAIEKFDDETRQRYLKGQI